MKLFKLGSTEVKCSPWLLAAIPAAAVLGGFRLLPVAFLSLSVHEAAHAMMAFRLGCTVESIEIQPFGFVARIGCGASSTRDMAAVYAAGPVASICMASLSALAERFVPVYAEASLGMTEYNLLIAAVNLLPAMPLDGGRLLCCALRKRFPRSAYALPKALGVLTGAGFLCVFALLLTRGALNVTFPVMGVFLMIAAINEKPPSAVIRPTRKALGQRSVLWVSEVAIPENTPIIKAFRMLPAGGYALVSVVDGSMQRIGVLDEKQLYDAVSALGSAAALKDAVAMHRGRML